MVIATSQNQSVYNLFYFASSYPLYS